MPLSRVRVVLVRPRGPINIGMSARAIANHGLGGLVLVDPRAFDPEEARWHAPGGREVIDRARIVGSVDEAVAGAGLVVGTTARRRRFDWPLWTADQLPAQVFAQPGETCLLFGPEDAGLSNEDLEPCHALFTLPTGETSSLNLAQAVTVSCHLLRQHLALQDPPAAPRHEAAPTGLLRALTGRAEEVLRLGGYLRGRSPEQVRGTLFRLLARLDAQRSEAAMMTGMLEHLRWTLTHPEHPQARELREQEPEPELKGPG